MGMSPIHYAGKKDFTDIIEHLITYGASVNAVETVNMSNVSDHCY